MSPSSRSLTAPVHSRTAKHRPRHHHHRRTADPSIWGRDAAPLTSVGQEDFRCWVMRNGKRIALLGSTELGSDKTKHWGGTVEDVTWDDVSAILTGQMTLRRPYYEADYPDIQDGDEIMLEYRELGGAVWLEAWDSSMRVSVPNHNLADGGIVYQLANDLQNLDSSTDDFVYQKTSKKKGGWHVDEVVADVCRRYGIAATITAAKHKVAKSGVARDTSPWQFLLQMVTLEQTHKGRRLFFVYKKNRKYPRGRLFLLPIQRSQAMLILGPTLVAAATELPRDSRFATAVTLRQAGWTEGTKDSKGHRTTGAKKMFVDFRLRAAVRRYGYIHRILYSPDATSRHDLMSEAKRWVVAVTKGKRTFTLTHPGVPTLRRGDAILLKVENEGLKVLIFAKELHFRVGGGEFTVSGTFALDDPYLDDTQQKIIDKLLDSPRTTAAKKSGGKKGSGKPGANQNRGSAGGSGGSGGKGGKPKGLTPGEKLKQRYGG